METKRYKLSEISLNVTDGEHGTVKDDNNGKYFLLSCKNIKNGLINITSNERIINEESFNKVQKRIRLEKNDVLITTVGTIGEMAIIETNDINYCFQRSVGIIKPNIEIVNPYYLYYSLKNETRQISTLIKGAVQKCLFINDMKMIEIDLPNMKVQNKIVKILNNIDKKIKINNEINNNLHELINRFYSNYLNELDEYTELDIKEIFDFETGVEPGSKNYLDKKEVDTIRFYRVGDMNSDCKTFIKEELSNDKLLTENDVVVSFDATIGRIGYGLNGSYSTGMKKITINSKYKNIVNNSLVYAYFNNKDVQNIMMENARGTTILHASSSIDFMKFKYNEVLLKKYSKSISGLFNEMKNIKKENEELSYLRDTLLPKLMNGEIELDNIEI